MNEKTIYTAITFAPVQGFIEKSRKLRDLYGSSFLLSYLAKALCQEAKERLGDEAVISPALINITQGTPNQILIRGDFSRESAKAIFQSAWQEVCSVCQKYLEEKLPEYKNQYHWQRSWNSWTNHAWEFFWAQSDISIKEARTRLSELKRERDWTGINWQGESSTLSGADGIAWYGMSDKTHPQDNAISEQDFWVEEFYKKLSQKLGESILDESEKLNIPELIKRLITLSEIANCLNNIDSSNLPEIEYPKTFVDLNRKNNNLEDNRYTGWFQGDGDSVGQFLQEQSLKSDEATALNTFSRKMMGWGKNLKYFLPPLDNDLPTIPETDISQLLLRRHGRVIYAGGDDFLGVLYRNSTEEKLTASECVGWFYRFPEIWQKHEQPITPSVGFVWAAPGVPQRDVLQHCRETEKLAKNNGRDRLAIRILFNSGNHLDWHCPWWFLQDLLESYRDRDGNKNWTHFYNDVAVLESRHAFNDDSSDVAKALFEIYFDDQKIGFSNRTSQLLENNLQGTDSKTKVLPDTQDKTVNNWIINLAKVGFHLYD